MKKTVWIALLLMLVCIFSFSACDQGDTPPTNDDVCQHAFGDWDTTKQATCKDEGELVRVCSKCSAEEKTTVAKTNVHTEVVDAAVPATCEESGLTEGKHCSYCNKVIVEQTVIEELGHKFVIYVSDGNATAEIDGTKTACCENTGCNKTDTITDVGSKLPTAHTHSYSDTVTAPTCTEQGYTTHSCTCGHSYIDTYTNATNHKFVTYVSDGNATTEADGTKTARCENTGCNKTDTVTDVGSKLPTIYSEGLLFVENSDGLSYSLAGKGECNDIDIVVPLSYNGKPITAISDNAFEDEPIRSIILPNSIKKIGQKAFYFCLQLEQVNIPNDTVSIGSTAFCGCKKLSKIHIPPKVSDIGFLAFRMCESLTTITVDEFNQHYSSDGHNLYNKEKNTIILFAIGQITTEFSIPDTVTIIGEYSFEDAENLISIKMPNTVTTIETSAFDGCKKLKEIQLSSALTSIGSAAFAVCVELERIDIPYKVTSIGSNAFSNCLALKSVTLPKGITIIESYTFYRNQTLTDIYYCGTESEWNSITIKSNNDSVTSATIHYDCEAICTHNIIIDNRKEPSCSETGLTEGSHCSICGSILVKQEVIPTTDHNEVVLPSRASTCSEVGLTEGLQCSVCKKIIVAQDELPKLEHTPTIILPYIAPTCSSFGWTEGKKCSVCQETVVPQTKIDKTSHDYIDGVCDDCGHEYSSSGITFQKYASYNGINRAAIVTGYTGTDTEVYIPRYVDGYIVLGINYNAFKNNTKITKVKLPNTVTFINGYAFSGCTKLESINIPESVTSLTGYGIFMDCSSLKSIVIPNSVTSLGDNIFNGCTKLASVTLSNKLTEIPLQGFLDCSSLTEITIPSTVTKIKGYGFGGCSSLSKVEILGGITSIGYSAFQGCSSLKEFTIPSTVKSIESCAFNACDALEVIIIPSSVTSMSYGVFRGCGSLTIYCEAEYEQSGWDEDWNDSDCPVYFDCANPNKGVINGIQWELIDGEISIVGYRLNETTIVIPSSIDEIAVTSIADFAFMDHNEITEVTIPLSIKTIGLSAFNGCTGIKIVNYGGTKAQWTALLSASESNNQPLIAATVKCSDGQADFDDVKYLEYTLNSDGNSYTITGIGTFNGSVLNVPSVYKGKTITAIGEFAFYECTNLTEVNIGNSIIEVGPYAFAKCSSLVKVIISDNVSTFGEYAFYWCSELTTVELSANSKLTSISKSMFSWCEKLSSITIPNGVTRIENYAFSGCDSLTSIVIPSKVTYIGDSAFSNKGLKSITIPVSVKTIDRAAFCNCTSLTTFNYAGTKTQWNNVTKGNQWADYSAFNKVNCSNGTVNV